MIEPSSANARGDSSGFFMSFMCARRVLEASRPTWRLAAHEAAGAKLSWRVARSSASAKGSRAPLSLAVTISRARYVGGMYARLPEMRWSSADRRPGFGYRRLAAAAARQLRGIGSALGRGSQGQPAWPAKSSAPRRALLVPRRWRRVRGELSRASASARPRGAAACGALASAEESNSAIGLKVAVACRRTARR